MTIFARVWIAASPGSTGRPATTRGRSLVGGATGTGVGAAVSIFTVCATIWKHGIRMAPGLFTVLIAGLLLVAGAGVFAGALLVRLPAGVGRGVLARGALALLIGLLPAALGAAAALIAVLAALGVGLVPALVGGGR